MLNNDVRIGGDILVIGGAEDKLNEKHIIRRFHYLAGGDNAVILIIPTASEFPEITANVYIKLFQDLGVKDVRTFSAVTRQDVINLNVDELFADVTGIFMTGGDQMRLTSMLGGTKFIQMLKQKVQKGAVLAGTSAGASGMSSSMIVRGDATVTPQKNSIRLSPGLAILNNIIIDQHFTQRTRLSRLISAVSYNPHNLGIGIDENTAILLSKNGILEVLGAGTVTIVDGSSISFNNIADVEENEPFSIFGMQVHIISSAIKYDIYNRKPIQVVGDKQL